MSKAVRAVRDRDAKLADEVIEADYAIDQIEVEAEEECLKVLALHQPVAIDLRVVIAMLKINNDLERVGDLAVNIAERGLYLATVENVDSPFDFMLMAEKVETMLRHSLDSIINLDTTLARAVWAADDEVDAINAGVYSQIHAAIRRQPEKVAAYINLLSVARHLERIADYATNIAEDAIYMEDGEIVRHKPEAFDIEK